MIAPSGEGLRELLEEMLTLDADFGRTWALMKAEVSRVSPRRVLATWLHLVVDRFADLPPASEASPRAILEQTIARQLPAKGKISNRSLNLWRLVLLDLRWHKNLSVHEIAATSAGHFVAGTERQEPLDGKLFGDLIRSSRPQLIANSRGLAWAFRLAATQAADLSATRRELKELQDSNRLLSEDVRSLRATCAGLRDDVSKAEARANEAERREKESRDTAILRRHALAGRVSGMLKGRVIPLLDQAREALAVVPARVKIADEFVTTVVDVSRESLTWLAVESTSEQPIV
jgi:hypothetical protein